METIEAGLIRLLFRLAGNPAAFLDGLRELWPMIVGKELARSTAPSSLENGLLTVEVPDADWLRQLDHVREILLSRIRSVCGAGDVKAVRFAPPRR